MSTIKCRKCGEFKTFDLFYVCSGVRQTICKECVRKRNKAYRKKYNDPNYKPKPRVDKYFNSNVEITGWNGDNEIYC